MESNSLTKIAAFSKCTEHVQVKRCFFRVRTTENRFILFFVSNCCGAIQRMNLLNKLICWIDSNDSVHQKITISTCMLMQLRVFCY